VSPRASSTSCMKPSVAIDFSSTSFTSDIARPHSFGEAP
jgi:hypothetical protein